ncbi:hypothetical protein F3J22_07615 [Chitinophaga sp. Cy-1792]|nr:hypothetical protein [Chitinophaga sp. Cy-1792]
MDSNYLSIAGVDENNIELNIFNKLPGIFTSKKIKWETDTNSYPLIQLLNDTARRPAVKYLLTTLYSNQDTNVVLLVNAAQALRVHLNNKLMYALPFKKSQAKFYEDYIPVHLNKGENTLMVKVGVHDFSSSIPHWHFSAAIATADYARENYAREYAFDILKKSCIPAGSAAGIYIGPYIGDTTVHYILRDDSGLIIQQAGLNKLATDTLTGYATLPLADSLQEKLISLEVQTSKGTLKQDFYYGDFKDYFKRLSADYEEIAGSVGSDRDRINLDAAFGRLSYLLKTFVTGDFSTVRYWDRNRIQFAKELSGYFRRCKANPGKQVPYEGFIHGFRSGLDTSLQYYLFHADTKMMKRGQKVPLLVIMPFPTNNDAPLLKSWFISNYDQLSWDSRLADENGFAVMWVNLRGNPGVNAISYHDLTECIKDASATCNIDTTAIFVLGNSAAATKTLVHAVRRPNLIAGCALVNPVLDRPVASDSLPHDHLETTDLLGNLYNSHVFIKCSIGDEKVPVDRIKSFYDDYKRNFNSSSLLIAKEGSHLSAPRDYYRDVFVYFKNKYRALHPAEIRFSTYSTQYNSSGWLSVHDLRPHSQGTINARLTGDTLLIHSNNIGKVTIRVQDLPISSEKVYIKLNSNPVFSCIKSNRKDVDLVIESIKENESHTPEEVFCKPVLLVYGIEAGNLEAIFSQNWRRKYFSSCPKKLDTNVTAADLQHYNLLLLGDVNNNKIIKQLAEKKVLSVANRIVTFNGFSFPEKNLSYLTLVSPFNTVNKCQLLYTSECTDVLPVRDISNENVYTFRSFRKEGEKYVLEQSGMF